jgi:hypothetical protein
MRYAVMTAMGILSQWRCVGHTGDHAKGLRFMDELDRANPGPHFMVEADPELVDQLVEFARQREWPKPINWDEPQLTRAEDVTFAQVWRCVVGSCEVGFGMAPEAEELDCELRIEHHDADRARVTVRRHDGVVVSEYLLSMRRL